VEARRGEASRPRGHQHGRDLIEVDVQRTKDGELVLVHGTNLVRTTDVKQVFPYRAPWRVTAFTYDEVLQLDAGPWKSPEYAAVHDAGMDCLVWTNRPDVLEQVLRDRLLGRMIVGRDGLLRRTPLADAVVTRSGRPR